MLAKEHLSAALADSESFRLSLQTVAPVSAAQGLADIVSEMPVGTRVANYVREAGEDRWRCEYSSTKRRRDGTIRKIRHASYTGCWSVALQIAFAARERTPSAERFLSEAREALAAHVGIARQPELRQLSLL